MRTFSDLQQLESRDQEVNLIERYIKSKTVPGAPLQILEAGCGQKWPINLDQTNYLLTAVDCDKAALAIRTRTAPPDSLRANLGWPPRCRSGLYFTASELSLF